MWIFARFFRRYRTDFLFLFLCILAFYMMYKSGRLQGLMLNNALINVAASVNSKSRVFTDYIGLKKQNQQLSERLVQLQNRKTPPNTSLDYSLANVSYQEIFRRENFMIIDKGSNAGVEEKMLVITTNNTVVGEVFEVTKVNSLVSTVMTTRLQITAELKDGTLGIAFWDASSFGHLKIKNIPSYVKVEKGDKVYTSGKGKFPEGILIGSIDKIDVDEATKFFIVSVKLATDFMRLNQVELIKDRDRHFIDTLLNVRDSLYNESEDI